MENTSKRSTFCLQNPLFLFLPCLFFLVQFLAVPVTGDSLVTPYNPIENITIDCGSSTDDRSLDNRLWIGDGIGKFTPIEQQNNNNKSSVSLTATQPPPSSVDKVPYYTARLSYSEFTYSIPLTAGQKFIRLYFYPTSYPGFDDPFNKAFFSVKAGPFTLLRNFSASLHARGEVTLIKEFCLNIDNGQRLNLTFTPSPDISDSYAFINGIEIVSMPTNLYYKQASDAGIFFLGQESLYSLGNNSALEMVYRVNVGGKQISPGADTGMFRSWLDDEHYLTIAKPSALPVNSSINLTFSNILSFSAPREVYVTARTMGRNKTENENYNLTWEFLVDSGFNYFVRLHFCEFQVEITKQGDRVFEIFLANLTAQTQADVIVWSGGNGLPVYRDYVVAIGTKGNLKQQSLSIALHPSPGWRTLYSDAILNGLEIFKLSNSFDLAGPNPDPVLINPPGNSPPSSTKPKNTNNTTLGIVVGVIAGFVVFSLLCFFIFRRKMRVKDSGSSEAVSWWNQFSSTTKSNKSTKSRGSSLPSDLCRYFSLAEIKGATNNFDNVFIIGVGGFGNVYKGFIDGGATQVAIKRLNPESQQGAHEFKTEIEMLSQLRHLHLVSLIGYCNDGGEMILVYDYMAHGTLRDHLYNTENPPLPWKQRLEICIGAARGLHYLHSGAKYTIIHRDVKTTNILLDEKWVAKVSDFGLSRVGPTNMSKAHVSTVVKGSFGYLDPEYYRRQQLTEKSDVYSFGVVLCEILCARPPISRTVEKEQASLAAWAQQCDRNGTLYKIIDPFLRGKIAPECLKKFTEVAMSCLLDEGIERPSMGDIVWSLEFALQLQENGEEGLKPNGGAGIEEDIDEESPFKNYGLEDDSGEVFSSIGDHVMNSKSTSAFSLTTSDEQSFVSKDSGRLLSKAVFSEIGNPQGR
ncbi:receptor-like protein kinase FERONIA [Durio zibethinus]|uniref:Receptor-like protein kinase FERONIA n=1 Tax=Durio zibethinus TaxID=66656 RepID=A0A6P6A338_DURZI|nr:receptor-like protein kinase FERONIA [Durio zibethinus]